MIYLLTAIGLPPGGSSTVHIYTPTTHRTTQNIFGRVRAVPRLCECNPGICLTTEEKVRKILSQGSRRVLVYILHITKILTHTDTHTHTHTLQNYTKHINICGSVHHDLYG